MFSVSNCTPIAKATSNRSGRPEAGLSWHGQWALRYDDTLGWLVIPAEAKRAIIEWNPFVLPARPDRETQVEWWQNHPKAQLALVTGARSMVIAIDADPRHGGSLEAFYERGWPRETPTARSGSCVEGDGGGHAYFSYPDDGLPVPSAPTYGDGCEVKSDGAIIVIAPSLHHTARRFYRWLPGQSPWDIPLAPVPDALLADLRARRIKQVAHEPITLTDAQLRRLERRAPRYVEWAVERARTGEDGGRHNSCVWLACQLRDMRVTDAIGRQCVLAYWQRLQELEAQHE